MKQNNSKPTFQHNKEFIAGLIILLIVVSIGFIEFQIYLSSWEYCTDIVVFGSEKISMAMDGSRNTYITGDIYYVENGSERIFTSRKLVIIKVNASNKVEWIRLLNISGVETKGIDVVIDGENFIYVTGGITRNSKSGILIVKVSPEGKLIWMKEVSFNASAQGWEAKIADGRLFFIGSGHSSNNSTIVIGSVITSNGSVIWKAQRTFNRQYNFVIDLDLDDEKHIYVLTASGYGNFTINLTRYSDNGTIEWEQKYVIHNHTINFGTPSTFAQLIMFPWNKTTFGVHVIHYNATLHRFIDIIFNLNRTDGTLIDTTTLLEASVMVFSENYIYRLLIGYRSKNKTHAYMVLEKYDERWNLIVNKTTVIAQDSIQPYQAVLSSDGNIYYVDTTVKVIKCTGFPVPRLNKIQVDNDLSRHTKEVIASADVREFNISQFFLK